MDLVCVVNVVLYRNTRCEETARRVVKRVKISTTFYIDMDWAGLKSGASRPDEIKSVYRFVKLHAVM